MHTKTLILGFAFMVLALPAQAENSKKHHPADHQHGADVFHMFTLETEYGRGRDASVSGWDMDGWIGTDENKLWLKAEGEREDNETESSELWAMYSRNVADFWDVQAGVRYDTLPESTAYGVFGVNGLAPYFFETQAHMFVSEEGDVSARLRQENEFLLTQKLILEPYAEINLFAQDVPEQDIGAGLSSGEFGVQTRYEITRKFAPYIDFRYERKFGETSSIAKNAGGENDDFITSVGIRFMF